MRERHTANRFIYFSQQRVSGLSGLILLLCKIFNTKFNTMSTVFAQHLLALPQKSILAKVCFDAKRGVLYMQTKWIFILWHRHFHPIWGCLLQNTLRFGAKCTAFWCKMECDLMLNAVCFGAKRKVKWCKMQCEVLLSTRRCV